MPGRLALFDLDRTLIDTNSGRLWIRSEWRAGRLGMWQVAKGSWWLLRYHLGHDGMEHAYRAAVASVTGEEEQLLAERTRQWFREQVAHRLRPGAREALQQHREAGDRLVVCTSSSWYAGQAAREAFGLDDVIATRFDVDDGRFTGEIAAMAYGHAKADRTREYAEREGFDLDEAVFYTDSMTDRRLMEAVGEPVAVHPDRRLAELADARGWRVETWGRAGDGSGPTRSPGRSAGR